VSVDAAVTAASRPRRPLSRQFSRVGLVAGAFFFSLSLFPSLLPRAGWAQGVVSGITLAIGYGLGAGVSGLWRYLELPPLRGRARRFLGIASGLAGLAAAVAIWRFVGWQNDLRSLLGMTSTGPAVWVQIAVVTPIVASLLLVLSRAVRWLFHWVIGRLRRLLPARLALTLGLVTGGLLLWLLWSGVLVQGFWGVANATFAPRDYLNKPGSVQPTSSARSGSPQSLVTWKSLGREGRAFVSGGPTVQDLATVSAGVPDQEPIRVYVGMRSADTLQQRADLLLAELKRTGAFDRKVLVVATTTGSGFLDPAAVDPLEYLWHGDTAIAGMQYSYLPSWLSLLADQKNVQQTAQVAFRTIAAYWETLPEDSRPRLYLYGLSLGSNGVESILTSIDLVNEPISGAFMSGPPFVNQLHAELTTLREPGSPSWRPVYQDGRTVRFTAQQPALQSLPGPWGPTRIAYLQHGSDPVVFFSGSLLLHKPDWLEPGQRAPDVTPWFTWAPFVTLWQVAMDLPAAGSVPWGYGHLYPPSENLPAWVAVTRPPGWTDTQLTALGQRLDEELSR
jgi:uncharacterized membrane protein